MSEPHPALAAAFFVSFILIGTMIVLNLVTGVIIRSMEEARDEVADAARKQRLAGTVPPLQEELEQISEQLQALSRRVAAHGPGPG